MSKRSKTIALILVILGLLIKALVASKVNITELL